MSSIALDTQETAELEKIAMRSLIGIPVTYCGVPYEVAEVDEQKRELKLENKTGLKICCDYESPYLKPVNVEEEQETKKKEKK